MYNITIRNKISVVKGYEINYSNVECLTINKTQKKGKSSYIQRIVNKNIWLNTYIYKLILLFILVYKWISYNGVILMNAF